MPGRIILRKASAAAMVREIFASNSRPIVIIGAGIAGLTLARSLNLRGIPPVVHESKTKERYAANHGLWLGSQICHLLCSELGTSLQELEHKSSVTAEVSDEVKASSATGLRVNKRRLLEFLAADVDVQWEHQLEDVTIQDNKIICAFKNGSTTEGRALIGADGVHSRVRSVLLPQLKPTIHPYVAINGQRRTPYRKYNEEHASENYRDDVFHESDAHGAHLSTGLNDVKTGKAYHFYTYSRPAKQKEDVLFKPDRSTSEANTIPPEFFGEIEASVFAPRFSRDSMKDDKMLSWLMRSFLPSENDLQKLPSGVALIGDAIHGTPILGGDGAEQAIQDAVTLGDMLANRKGEIQDTLTEFSTQALSRWEGSVKDSVARLEQMHSPKSQL